MEKRVTVHRHSVSDMLLFSIRHPTSQSAKEKVMTAGRICTTEVDLVDEIESVQVAAERMNSRNVGTLIVLD